MSLDNWQPEAGTCPFFGIRRSYQITLPNGRKLIGDPYVRDFRTLSWAERLFSQPWQPWVRTAYAPVAYVVDGNIIVSIKTFLEFERESK